MIWFTVLAMPMFLFAAALAVDFTKVITTHRNVTNVAQAAAEAGAWQLVDNHVGIDGARGGEVARGVACEGLAHSSSVTATNATAWCPGGASVPFSSRTSDFVAEVAQDDGTTYPGGYQTFEVTIEYRVTGLLFMKWFDGDAVTGKVVQQASACLPGVAAGPTGGVCVRPEPGS